MHISVKSSLSSTDQPYIVEAIKHAIADLPQGIKHALQHINISVANKLSDIHGQGASPLARGWAGASLDSAWACYATKTHTIEMAQTSKAPYGLYTAPFQNPYHAFLHELGHAFHLNAVKGKDISASKTMRIAYERDIRTITDPRDIARFNYYLKTKGGQTSKKAARQEVFAQSFANIIAGLDNTYIPAHQHAHKRLFAHCYAVVEQYILSIAPDARLYPRHLRNYPSTQQPAQSTYPTTTNKLT